jgi:hypothetical protein
MRDLFALHRQEHHMSAGNVCTTRQQDNSNALLGKGTAMNVRRITMVVVLVGLALAPVLAMAQCPGHQMGMRGRMGSDSGSMMQMQGMM